MSSSHKQTTPQKKNLSLNVPCSPRIKRYLFTLVDLAGVTIPSQIGLSLHNIKTGKKITEEFLCTWNLVDFLAHDGMVSHHLLNTNPTKSPTPMKIAFRTLHPRACFSIH